MSELAWTRIDLGRRGLGRVVAADAGRGLCLLVLGEARAEGELARWMHRHEPGMRPREADVGGPSGERLGEVRRQLEAYAGGRRTEFTLELDLRGSSFELGVWAALARIPFGRTRTYGELAEDLARPGAARAVGAAAGRNPIPIVVPCHRLVARGGLGGFTGGLERKRALLALEGLAVGRSAGGQLALEFT